MLQTTGTVSPDQVLQIIWQQCWNIDVFGKKFKVCLRVVRDNTKLFFEIEADGKVARIPLANACITAFTLFGVIEIKLCLSDVEFDGPNLKRLCIEVEGCAGFLGCATLVKHCQGFRALDVAMKTHLDWSDDLIPDGAHVTAA